MTNQRLRIALIGAWIVAGVAAGAAQQSPGTSTSQTRREPLVVSGRVTEIHAPRLFTLRETDGTRELVVLVPRPLSPSVIGAAVKVEGAMRRLATAELNKAAGPRGLDERTRARLAGRSIFVATSLAAALQGERATTAGVETEPPPQEPASPQQPRRALHETLPSPLTIRASTLVAHLDGFAGQQVRIVSARVVGLLEPRTFLVEPATEYLKSIGTRDRIVVFVRDGSLSVPADIIVGSTVVLEGVARTLLGMRVTREVPWPDRLTDDTVDRLEVRAAVLATSVRTAEGVELTSRATSGS